MVIKTKSHPMITYLDTNNFYGLAIIAVYSSNLKSVNLVKRLHTNNQQNYKECLKPRSNKNKRGSKKCGCNYFYVLNY